MRGKLRRNTLPCAGIIRTGTKGVISPSRTCGGTPSVRRQSYPVPTATASPRPSGGRAREDDKDPLFVSNHVGRAEVGEYGYATADASVLIVLMVVAVIGIRVLVGTRQVLRREAPAAG